MTKEYKLWASANDSIRSIGEAQGSLGGMIDNMDPEDPNVAALKKSIADLDKAQKRVRLVVPNVSVRPQVKRYESVETIAFQTNIETPQD